MVAFDDDVNNSGHLHCLLRRSCLHKLKFWRRFLHLVLLLVDESVVADRLAHLEVFGLALVVLARQVLVHVAHFREGLLADWARVPGEKSSYTFQLLLVPGFPCIILLDHHLHRPHLVSPLILLLSSSSMFSLLLSDVVGLPGLFKSPFMSPLERIWSLDDDADYHDGSDADQKDVARFVYPFSSIL